MLMLQVPAEARSSLSDMFVDACSKTTNQPNGDFNGGLVDTAVSRSPVSRSPVSRSSVSRSPVSLSPVARLSVSHIILFYSAVSVSAVSDATVSLYCCSPCLPSRSVALQSCDGAAEITSF